MKQSSALVIGIPLLVIGLIVAGVFVYKSLSNVMTPSTQQLTVVKEVPKLKGEVGKPTGGFETAQPTSSTEDLTVDLRTTFDDGGATSLAELEAELAKLN